MSGSTYTITVICTDCGFVDKKRISCWGDVDLDDEHATSEHCEFCKHARKLGIKLPKKNKGQP